MLKKEVAVRDIVLQREVIIDNQSWYLTFLSNKLDNITNKDWQAFQNLSPFSGKYFSIVKATNKIRENFPAVKFVQFHKFPTRKKEYFKPQYSPTLDVPAFLANKKLTGDEKLIDIYSAYNLLARPVADEPENYSRKILLRKRPDGYQLGVLATAHKNAEAVWVFVCADQKISWQGLDFYMQKIYQRIRIDHPVKPR